jgi:hypothetical protein
MTPDLYWPSSGEGSGCSNLPQAQGSLNCISYSNFEGGNSVMAISYNKQMRELIAKESEGKIVKSLEYVEEESGNY